MSSQQITFTMVGLGEPRQVRAGVVTGNYFEVMGLRPALGRLLKAADDGPSAAGAAVLTYRFWSTGLHGDPSALGQSIRLGTRNATIVGVLEPSDPYPAETELIAIQPRRLLTGVLAEGLAMASIGIVSGAAGGLVFLRILGTFLQQVQLPGLVPIIGSIIVLLAAAALASFLPAARAARIDVVQALRTE